MRSFRKKLTTKDGCATLDVMPYKKESKQTECKKTWDDLHPENSRARVRKWASQHREELAIKQKQYYIDNPSKYLLLVAKQRARGSGLPFELIESDIVIPELCPALGIPLARGDRGNHDNSPSIDQTTPGKGYVKGNISIVSHRANRIKSDSTLEELEMIVAYVKKLRGEVAETTPPQALLGAGSL